MDALCLAALIFVLLPFSDAIQCYYCVSDSDSRCVDTRRFESSYQVDQPSTCTQEAVDTTLTRTKQHMGSPDGEKGNFACIKIEISNRHDELNKTIIRGCAQANTRNFDSCSYISRHFMNPADMIHCSVCSYDSCNGASLASVSFWIAIPLLMTLRYALRCN